MKSSSARIVLIAFLLAVAVPSGGFAAGKTFVKEYTYTAGDEDSKNSSRVIALREVKRLLLEELGTYLESRTEVKNFQLTMDQITTLTAGIVQTEIVEEKWDGRAYWLKSRITADPDQVAQTINELRRDREKSKELESLRRKSDELLKEVERLKKEMASKEGNRDLKKAEYDQSIRKLSAAEWIEKGHALFVPDEKPRAAFDAYSRAIELDPENVQAYYYRAQTAPDKNQAMSDYYKLLSIEPKDSEAHYARAWTYRALDQIDSALQEFGKAIDRADSKKEKAAAYQERGRFYMLSHVFKPRGVTGAKAAELQIADFSSAIELDPGEAENYSLRGAAYISAGKYDLALRDKTAAITINPKEPRFYSGRAGAYRMLGKRELAVADLTRAIELNPHSIWELGNDYLTRADDYEELGKPDLAIADVTRVIEIEPDYFVYTRRGDLYRKSGKYDLAFKDYSKAIELDPKVSGGAYYGRALVHAVRGDVRKSLSDLRKAIPIKPSLRHSAKSEEKFGEVRKHPEFKKLVQ